MNNMRFTNPAAIILAAGRSSRMGTTKPLMLIDGLPMLVHAAEAFRAATIDYIIVVTGFDAERVQALARESALHPIYNSNFDKGMFTSVCAGIEALPAEFDSVFVLPVDIPFVSPQTLKRLQTYANREHGANAKERGAASADERGASGTEESTAAAPVDINSAGGMPLDINSAGGTPEAIEKAGALLPSENGMPAAIEKAGALLPGENSLPAAAHSRSVVIPRYKGKAGHPPLIHRSIFGQLLGWRGPEGLGGFLKAQSFLVTYLDVEDPFILRDIDTPHDMQSLISERNLRGPSGFHS